MDLRRLVIVIIIFAILGFLGPILVGDLIEAIIDWIRTFFTNLRLK